MGNILMCVHTNQIDLFKSIILCILVFQFSNVNFRNDGWGCESVCVYVCLIRVDTHTYMYIYNVFSMHMVLQTGLKWSRMSIFMKQGFKLLFLLKYEVPYE